MSLPITDQIVKAWNHPPVILFITGTQFLMGAKYQKQSNK